MRVICDESGAKGKASNRESFPGETGVFVGVLVPDADASAFEADLRELVATYQSRVPAASPSAPGKLHVAHLPSADQQQLRTDVWAVMRRHRTRWVYEAAYVEGFHVRHADHVTALTALRDGRTSRIRLSSNLPAAPSLHVALFEGLCATAFGVVLDDAGTGPIVLDVVVDHVDDSLAKAFRAAVHEVIAPLGGSETIRGVDPRTGDLVTGTVTTVVGVHDADLEASTFTLTVVPAGDPTALAADVLANSLDRHFRTLQAAQLGTLLHTPDAVVGHPVADLVAGISGATLRTPDAIFPYPKSASST